MGAVVKVLAGLPMLALAVLDTKEYTDKAANAVLTWATSPNKAGTLTRDWPLADLQPALRITAGYLAFVAFGSLLRKPGEREGKVPGWIETPIKGLQLIYNLVQCLLCGWMIYAAIVEYIASDYVLVCNKFDVNRAGMAKVLYVFYLSKILDFCDTFFIITRQKWIQLSFLHVYHHASIFLVYWMNTNVGYDGDIYLTIVLNAFVHLVMYSYYFLTTLKIPAPWKAAVTQLQMIQFLTMNAQALYILFFSCPFPRNVTLLYFFYIVSLFLLFSNFYVNAYKKPSSSSSSDSKKGPAKDVRPKKD